MAKCATNAGTISISGISNDLGRAYLTSQQAPIAADPNARYAGSALVQFVRQPVPKRAAVSSALPWLHVLVLFRKTHYPSRCRSFVSRNGSQLQQDGSTYRFAGMNCYYLMQQAADNSTRHLVSSCSCSQHKYSICLWSVLQLYCMEHRSLLASDYVDCLGVTCCT